MAETIVRGDDLMIFDESGKSFAYATSHVLTVTADAQETSSKDSGKWKANAVNKLGWEITTENLFSEVGYDKLMTAMINRTEVDLSFGIKNSAELNMDGLTPEKTEWTKGTKGYQGKAIITSCVANANTGENATYSVTFVGNGALTAFGA